MPAHLPDDAAPGARPQRIVPLLVTLGEVAGHELTLLSLEVWPSFADLRFARVAGPEVQRPLPRRVPPPDAWRVDVDGEPVQVWDAVGRGDRDFSNGEVRLRPAPPPGAELHVSVTLLPGTAPLDAAVTV